MRFRLRTRLQKCNILSFVFIFSCSVFIQDAAFALTSTDQDCRLEEGRILCKSGDKCINATQVCDKTADCQDGSDEFSGCEKACDGIRCQHRCVPDISNDNEGVCFCREGFRISGVDRTNCHNVNECEEKFGVCSQVCSDTEGSFTCSCLSGFKLNPNDSATCTPDNPNAKLVFALRSSIKVLSLATEKLTTVAARMGQTVGVTFDAGREEVYWTDVMDDMEAIYRAKLDGSGIEIIVDTGIVLGEGIAYDWIAENIYFTDSNLTHIGVCDRNGKFCTVVVQEQLDKPREIVLHPKSGKMFWTDWGAVASIVAAGMDGSAPTPIVEEGLNWPNGLALDHGSERIFWIDASRDVIETCKLSGEDRRVVKATGIKHPFSMDVFADTLYWSDWTLHAIQSCNKFNGENHATIYKEDREQINGITVFHRAAQPRNRVNHCMNHRCSHICVLTPTHSFRCMCPIGMLLDVDGRTCKDDKKREKLFLVEGSQLKLFYFHSIGRDVIQTRNVPGLRTISAAVHNPINDTFILYDSYRNTIFTYNYTSNTKTTLVNRHLDSVRGLGVDVIGQNLYWADAGKQTVEVLSLRTGARAVIYHELTYRPFDVAVVPNLMSIFITTVGNREGQILRLDMDGDEIDVLFHIVNGEPTAIAYHHELDHIFWCDHLQGTIEHASVDGQTRYLAIQKVGSPYSLAAYKNRILWTDRYSEALRSLIIGTDHMDSPIYIGGEEDRSNDTLHGNFFTVIGIINKDFSYLKDVIEHHECSPNPLNGTPKNCSHICVPAHDVQKGKCLCPVGLELAADGATCEPRKTCLPGQFRCASGLCISEDSHCDQFPDCPGREDETNCPAITGGCRASDFVCKSDQTCISGVWKCDGEKDCPDGSDEEGCPIIPCPDPTDVRCKLGRCLPASWKCDHVVDCPDGDETDELGCNFTCKPEEFKCSPAGGHECIPANWVCDGEKDCTDGSDEPPSCKEKCKDGEFRCMNQKCVRSRLVCNGRDDCGDNSDEASCAINGTAGFLPGLAIRGTTIPFNLTTISPRHGGSKCPPNTFWCYSGECIEFDKVCNGRTDCFDGSDENGPMEQGCSHACGVAHECSHTCKKSPRGSVCTCPPGYKLGEDQKYCDDIDECQENVCTHFCKNLKGSYKCTCHEEYVLRSDHKTCKAKGHPPFFIYSRATSPTSPTIVHIAPQDMQSSDMISVPSGLSGMDVDARGGYIYWSNGRHGLIGRSSTTPNQGNQTLFKNLSMPTVLAYDWISHNIYVVARIPTGRDRQRKLVIKICSVRSDPNKRLCYTLYHLLGREVTDIAVSPADNYVFWTEISFSRYAATVGAIRRGRVDRVENINLASDKIINPTGLALDHVFKRVFWIDAGRQVVEAVNFDGTKRSVIIAAGSVSQRAIGLAVFENWVMWSEDGKSIRCRMDMQAPCMHVTMHNTSDARYLKLLQPALQPSGRDPCAGSPCSYICTGAVPNRRQNYTCYCPDGYVNAGRDNRICRLDRKPEPVWVPAVRTDVIEPTSDDMDNNSDLSPGVQSRRTNVDNDSSSGGVTAVIVCLTLLVICLIIGAVIYYQRNGSRPKILVRPYVQQWVKYVNDPMQRWRRDSRREPLTNQDAYSEVYEATGSEHAYENPVYDGNVKQNRFRKGKSSGGGGGNGSRADSGILTLADSDGPAPYEYEDISDGHYISYSQRDKLLDKEFT